MEWRQGITDPGLSSSWQSDMHDDAISPSLKEGDIRSAGVICTNDGSDVSPEEYLMTPDL